MTPEAHRDLHKDLHHSLLLLITDFTYHTKPSPTVQLEELEDWSFLKAVEEGKEEPS